IINAEDYDDFIKREPAAKKFIRPYSMGLEFLHGIPRWCLWLADCSPHELRQMPQVLKRVQACKDWRSAQVKTGDAYKLKDTPTTFRPCKQFRDTPFIAVPLVSSERRSYIPMAYVDNGMIPGNNLFAIFDATLYHFGVLTSSVHMGWMRMVCGRLKSDYRYSATIVYNNFPWCTPTDTQRRAIEQTAQKILDARAKYPDSTLADLYDELTMPADLRRAHRANDRAVAAAYGFVDILDDERAIVAALFDRYVELTT
ncbi:MAG: hypothetical protein SR2Q5_08840, partial [Quinella sp. 2Q5]|nr:hypothetical protein [Quinella sp. 2Q5]